MRKRRHSELDNTTSTASSISSGEIIEIDVGGNEIDSEEIIEIDDSESEEPESPHNSLPENKEKIARETAFTEFDFSEFDFSQYRPRNSQPVDHEKNWEENDEITEDNLAFCCLICTCSKDRKKKFENEKFINCGNSGNPELWHRYCCHTRNKEEGEDTLSPVQKAVNAGIDSLETEVTAKILKGRELDNQIKQAERNEKMEVNKMHTIESDSKKYSDPYYLDLCKKYYKIKKRVKGGKLMSPAVVLDVFSGVGSAILTLKKLKISMSRVIHVDIDPVARHVSKFNHCYKYNKELVDDDIDHVFEYKKFEELKGDNFEKFMTRYAPIDIILGGPPCGDFSAVNAYRKGSAGTSGHYLMEFGEFITQVQEHPMQQQTTVFFLSENVVTQEDYPDVIKSYGFEPLCLDAQRFSPCRRNRVYWTSLPIRNVDNASEISEQCSVANGILEDGWLVPAQTQNLNIPLKANTFMASKSRLDDTPRMLKIKKEKNKFVVSTFSVYEREKMLGLPKGYVEDAVKDLFSQFTKALSAEFESNDHWKNHIDLNKFRDFLSCRYQFGSIKDCPYFEPKVRIPNENKISDEYLTCEQYAKRLLGNGWSIPVVEFLLQPLQDIFPKKDYGVRYNYVFNWEPYNCL